MGKTDIKPDDIKVNKNLNMNNHRAVNAQDAQQAQDYVTKSKFEETIEEIEEGLEWQGLQW